MITPEQFQMLMGNPQMLSQQTQAFSQQLSSMQSQMSPQARVMQAMQDGSMSQEDFQRCRQMANALMHVNY